MSFQEPLSKVPELSSFSGSKKCKVVTMKAGTQEANIYNFGAGPSCLPTEVLNQIVSDIPDWYDAMSVMEISHRLPVFIELTESIEKDLRQLLAIPEEFSVLFMHGGARGQFAAIPLNLLGDAESADYLVTGHWSNVAFQEAQRYCLANLVASSKNENYVKIPDASTWVHSQNGAYFHYTDNETIHGVEFHQVPQVDRKWLVSDMTSNILTKPIDFSRFGLIYASAQKNLGIAGIVVVIVRKSLLGNAHQLTPSILDYGVYDKTSSMHNTPPVFCWYVLGLMLKWALQQGGMASLAKACHEKAKLIYDVIDSSDYYINAIHQEHRSRINIPFRLKSPELESLFIQKASDIGLKQLKGHKVVGGCRASIYNAMPLEGVKALTDFMKTFEKNHG